MKTRLILPVLLIIFSLFFISQYFFYAPVSYQFLSQNTNFYPFDRLKFISPTIAPEQKARKSTTQDYYPEPSGERAVVPILMYHYIGYNPNPKDKPRDILSTTPDKFKTELEYIKTQGFTTITLDTLYAALKKQTTLPNKSIILTFDDGYIDFYYNAYPLLKEFNYKATVFIPTGLMDQGPYLRWNQIEEMQASGLISFGAHTVHHSELTYLNYDHAWREISESKKTLEEKLGVPVNFISYPFGASNKQIIELSQKAGFLGGVGTWYGKLQSEGTIFNMPRVRINGTIDLSIFSKLF